MKSRDRRNFSSIAAGAYAVWALIVYFVADHAWWPMFLYPFIWPVSYCFERILKYRLLTWLGADSPHPTPESFILFDRIAGAFYLIAGTLWVWLIGFLVLTCAERIFRSKASELAR